MNLVGILLLMENMYENIINLLKKSVSMRVFILIGKKYNLFPRVTFPSELVMLSPQLLLILIGQKFGAEITGFYSLCQRIILSPFILFGVGISEVVRSDISRKRKTNSSVKKELITYLGLIFLFDLLIFIVIKFVMPIVLDSIVGIRYLIINDYLDVLFCLCQIQ